MKNLLLIGCLLMFSCNKEEIELNSVEVTGVIYATGITTYQYGTHSISGNGESFALKSKSINLDDFIGQEKTIIGKMIDGYPVDGGPEYIDVEEIK